MGTQQVTVGETGEIVRDLPQWVDRTAYPFTVRSLRLPSGYEMRHVDEGHGEPILFVHGTPSWSFEWRHVIRELSGAYRCIAPDLLGFGLSERPRDLSYTPEAHARELASFVEALGLRDITLVVHDFGGPIALPLALERRGVVRRLVVLNSFMWRIAEDPQVARVAAVMSGKLGKFLYERLNFSPKVIMPSAYADRRKLTPAIHAQYLAPFPDRWSRGAVLWTLARALFASGDHYESLWRNREALAQLPMLIIWGMKDPAFKPNALDRWRQAAPHASVVELPVGHWPQEEAPDEIVVAVREWLAKEP